MEYPVEPEDLDHEITNIRDTMSIFQPTQDKSSRQYALQCWVKTCSDNADKHARKASYLRSLNVFISTGIIICSALSSIVSAMAPSFSDSHLIGQAMAYSVSICTALTSILSGVMGIQDPSGRRREHLIAENIWDVLGRDISMSIRYDIICTETVELEKTVMDFQRRIDNAITISPP